MHDCDVAIAVADAGAAVVRRSFGTTLQRLDKGAGDFATHADIEAEHTMCAVLHRERPADATVFALAAFGVIPRDAFFNPENLQRILGPASSAA